MNFHFPARTATCAAAHDGSALSVTLCLFATRSLFPAPPEMPPGFGRPVFRPARLTVPRLTTAPRFCVVTLRALRDGQLLVPPQKTPCACGATAFSPAGLAVSLLPGAPRFCVGAALVAARGRVWAPAPTSLYFLPSRIATHQGGPACPFKAIYLLSASAPWAGTSPAPTPRLQGAPAQKDTPQAMPAACPPLLPFFSSGCGRSPDPARPSLSVPGPHRHRHGCRMPWRTLDPA